MVERRGKMNLLGTFSNTLDAKNRVFFPAKFREDLGPSFVITVNLDKCLSVYSLDEWEKYTEKLKSLPKTKVLEITRFICGLAMNATPDAQGRVMLTRELVEYASLKPGKDGVTFIGCGDRVEIWPAGSTAIPDLYNAAKVDEIRDLMLEFGL